MSSPTLKTTTPSHSLPAQLQQIGLRALPAQLDDFLAHAAKARWSPHQILEQLAQVEITERSRRSLERRLRLSGIKRFKPMADFEWSWPTKIERDVVERALTLDFLPEGRNLVLVGRNGLGKTMIAQNICHPINGGWPRALNRDKVTIVQHERQRRGGKGSPRR
jgi:DNA replication protein DnaC